MTVNEFGFVVRRGPERTIVFTVQEAGGLLSMQGIVVPRGSCVLNPDGQIGSVNIEWLL